MEIFGIAITILSGVLAYFAWSNGRWMKNTLAQQNGILNKQTEMLNKQTEMLNKQTEMLNKQTEMLNKQTEMLFEIKNIIVEESRLTREMILKMDENWRETFKHMDENAEKRHMEVIQILAKLK